MSTIKANELTSLNSGNSITIDDIIKTTEDLSQLETDYSMTQEAVTDALNTKVGLSGDQPIEGTKTFSSFPVTPSAAPTDDYQMANKKYVDDTSNLHPSMTGSITLNGTTDNTVVMSDIVAELALEVGDVIRIDAGVYNKLHTVESIANNSSIIVNYEHAGNRGDGSLKLPDFTGQATVTRIAKWFNAPIGIGQALVNTIGLRSHGVIYTNTSGRTIMVTISIRDTGVGSSSFEVSGVQIELGDLPGGGQAVPLSMIVPNGATYRLNLSGASIASWAELR